MDVEILAPCAMENQITASNARQIKARILAEGANGPTTPEADQILHQKGVFVLPDILTNAGGVTVDHFEWVQDLQSHFWRAGRHQQGTDAHHDTRLPGRRGHRRARKMRHAAGGLYPRGQSRRGSRAAPRHLPVNEGGCARSCGGGHNGGADLRLARGATVRMGLMRRHPWTLPPLQRLRLQPHLSQPPALTLVNDFIGLARRSPACGDSRKTTGSRKASTTRWR